MLSLQSFHPHALPAKQLRNARNCEMPARVLSSREFCTLSVDLSKESSNRVRKKVRLLSEFVDVVAFL